MDKQKYNRAAKDPSQLQQFVDETVEELNEQEEHPVIKAGYYISDTGSFKYIGDELPENYSGATIFIGDDGYCYIEDYINGEVRSSLEISQDGVTKISAQEGNPVTVYGEDADGNLVKGAVSSGTKFYKHLLHISGIDSSNISHDYSITVISTNDDFSEEFDSVNDVIILLKGDDDDDETSQFISLVKMIRYINGTLSLSYYAYVNNSFESRNVSIQNSIVEDTVTPL